MTDGDQIAQLMEVIQRLTRERDECRRRLEAAVEALRTIATKEVWASRMKAIAQEAIAAATAPEGSERHG